MPIALSNLFLITTLGLTGAGRHLPPVEAGKEVEAARYELELDGVAVGWVSNLTGGEVGADVVSEKIGSDVVGRKHIGNVKYEDISFRSGLELNVKLYDWLKSAMAGDISRHNGAIIATDFNLKPIRRLEFTNALISEVSFPSMDAASKDAGWITFRISPEQTKSVAAHSAPPYPVPSPRKIWEKADFKLSIPGIDCSHVEAISTLNIKEKVIELGTGHIVDPEGKAVDTRLEITVPVSERAAFDTWHQQMLLAGANHAQTEKTGNIFFLSRDLKTPMATLDLPRVGINKISDEKNAAGKVEHIRVELYFAQAKLVL